MFGSDKKEDVPAGVETTVPATDVPMATTPILPETQEEENNEEAAEKHAEESTDLASELADGDKEPEPTPEPEPAISAEDEIIKAEQKAVIEFNEFFAGQNPLAILVSLAKRIKEIENKIF